MRKILPFMMLVMFLVASGFAQAQPSQQLSQTATWATHAANEYQVYPNVTYLTMGDTQLKMDIYRHRATTPQPTLIYIHGGFWVAGNKEGAILSLLPWMEMGWNVVNVEYRLGPNTLAPGAVEDCFCALRFVAQQAMMYGVDVNRIVVTGESAGGHLALALGILPESEGFDRECAANGPMPKVAAVINWFGITDVPDVIDGANRRAPAERWFGSMPNRMEIAKRVSPLTYVRAGLPPILTVHGDADPTVPYPEAVALHKALEKVKVPNQLLTIPGGKHGGFTPEERTRIYLTIREFLSKNGIKVAP